MIFVKLVIQSAAFSYSARCGEQEREQLCFADHKQVDSRSIWRFMFQ
ncbi:hypothetical protein CLOSTMETH_00345 [[Clostridium] methylpentosum DSM 5476]|uniref:Uncharacterized protein n=1 Tax=[Clostridium] methylpentosum DSM 5476 TaxID=537013 RepID=C0E950_9FIRM|nr:hypothetical protein CLOSTMETH_00345 [[Clostridium] methylpentosum DSM 5476]